MGIARKGEKMRDSRLVPKLVIGDPIDAVLKQFKAYERVSSMFETPRERVLWKRGYICALVDTEKIDTLQWNTLINKVNSEEKREDK